LHPALLDALARDFARNKYDLKRLLRTICLSRVYQLDHKPFLETDKVFFSRRRLARLEGDLLIRVVAQVAGVKPSVLEGTAPFLDARPVGPFQRPTRNAAPGSCERPNPEAMGQAGLASALHLLNSDIITKAITHPEGRIARLVAARETDEKIIEELFLATLSHPATPEQHKMALAHVKKAKDAAARKIALEDVLWALLNSKEFLFIP